MTLTLPKLQSPHLQNSGVDPEAKVGDGRVGFQLLQNLHEVLRALPPPHPQNCLPLPLRLHQPPLHLGIFQVTALCLFLQEAHPDCRSYMPLTLECPAGHSDPRGQDPYL